MARYSNSTILKTSTGTPYYRGKLYPIMPLSEDDNYVITTVGDRLDNLAYQYYRDSELYWIISIANNNITKGSIFPIPGTQLRIPGNINPFLNLFSQTNR